MSVDIWWKTIGKLVLAIATLPAYIWFKESTDWSPLLKLKSHSKVWTVVEGVLLALLVLFILFGLPRLLSPQYRG